MAAQRNNRPQQKPNQPAEKKSSLIMDFLMFPWKIQRAYAQQGKKIRKIIRIADANKKPNIAEDCKYRLRRQNYLTLIYIILPIWIGLGISSFTVYSDRAPISKYANAILNVAPPFPKTRPAVKAFVAKNGGFAQIKNKVKSLGKPPLKLNHFWPVVFGYFGSFFGALTISMNRAFSIQDKLRLIFLKRKMLDADDKPWEVCWTPSAILIETWNIDVDKLVDSKEIWGEADIKPDCTLRDPKKPGTIVLAESQDLPKEVKIMFNEQRVADTAKNYPKAVASSLESYAKELQAQEAEDKAISEGRSPARAPVAQAISEESQLEEALEEAIKEDEMGDGSAPEHFPIDDDEDWKDDY